MFIIIFPFPYITTRGKVFKRPVTCTTYIANMRLSLCFLSRWVSCYKIPIHIKLYHRFRFFRVIAKRFTQLFPSFPIIVIVRSSTPFEVINTVIDNIFVLMVYLFIIVRVGYKRTRNQPVFLICFAGASQAKHLDDISILVLTAFQNPWLFPFVVIASSTASKTNGANLSSCTCFVKTFITRDRFPNFIHHLSLNVILILGCTSLTLTYCS